MAEVPFGPPLQNGESGDKTFKAIAKDYPAVAQVLQGRTKEMVGGVFAPCTIMLTLEMDVLKVCFSPKYGAHVAFSTVDDFSDIIGCLERLIKAGKVDWRPRKSNK